MPQLALLSSPSSNLFTSLQVVDLGLPALSRPLAGVGAEEVDPFEGEEGDEGGMGDEEGHGLGPEVQVRGCWRIRGR